MIKRIQNIFSDWNGSNNFSGVFSVSNSSEVLFQKACGYRNKAEMLPNQADTAFGIASGTKFFTELAACRLIDCGKLSLDDRIADILPYDLSQISKSITVYHLLTHSSGVGDYIDEEAPDVYNDIMNLYNKYPVYLWDQLSYYLPMFVDLPKKFEPGERYGYSNAGFILLGLVIEQASGMSYRQYVTQEIILPCNMRHTGYYRMDRLPGNTALGYVYDKETALWRTNIFCIPAIGGSDGGIFTCAGDLDRLWRGLINNKLLSESTKTLFLTPHISTSSERKNIQCGLGVFLYGKEEPTAYYAVGGDFGVDFFTVYYPKSDVVISALGNTEMNTWPLLMELCSALA